MGKDLTAEELVQVINRNMMRRTMAVAGLNPDLTTGKLSSMPSVTMQPKYTDEMVRGKRYFSSPEDRQYQPTLEPTPLPSYPGMKVKLVQTGIFNGLKKLADNFDHIIEPYGGSGFFGNKLFPGKSRVLNDTGDVQLFHEVTRTKEGADAVANKVRELVAPMKRVQDKYPNGGPEAVLAAREWLRNFKSLSPTDDITKAAVVWLKNSSYTNIRADAQQFINIKGQYWLMKPSNLEGQLKTIRRNPDLLKSTTLTKDDGSVTIRKAGQNDLILDDHPYPKSSSSKSSGTVIGYGDKITSVQDVVEHIRNDLAPAASEGKHIVSTNYAHAEIREAYEDAGFIVKSVLRETSNSMEPQRELVAYTSNLTDAFPQKLSLSEMKRRIADGTLREEDLQYQYKRPKAERVSSTNVAGLEPEAEDLLRVVLADHTPERISWDATEDLAHTFLQDPKKMRSILATVDKGGIPNAGEMRALVLFANEANKQLRLMMIPDAGDVATDYFALGNAALAYKEVAFARDKAANDVGRTLRILAKDSWNMIRELDSLASLSPAAKKALEKLDKTDPVAVKKWLKDYSTVPTVTDYLKAVWYSDVLSGPPTQLVNIASNSIWGFLQLGHRALQATVDAGVCELTGAERKYFLGEVIPMWLGMKAGVAKGRARAMEVLRTGELKEETDESKWFYEIGESAVTAFERSPHTALNALAPYVTMPSRALRAADVFAKTIAFDGEMQALAFRTAKLKGLAEGSKAFDDFTANFVLHPDRASIEHCGKFANYATFMDEPGQLTKSITSVRNAVPGGFLVIPFVRTIANITKRGLELIPGIGTTGAMLEYHRGTKRYNEYIATKAINPNSKAKEVSKPVFNTADVVAKQLEGAFVSAVVLSLFSQGKITADVPQDPSKRDAFYREGKLPWSIKVGDTWYSYRRMEPLNLLLSTIAIREQALLNAKDGEEATKIFGDCAYAVFHNFLNSTYTSNMLALADEHSTIRMLERIPASFVPYSAFWNSLSRSYDSATKGEVKARESKGVWNQLSNTLYFVPGVQRAEARRDVFGTEVVIPGNVFEQWLPYKRSRETVEPLETELERLRIYPAVPDRTVRGVIVPDTLYREYAYAYGVATKQALQRVIGSRSYQAASDLRKVKLLDRAMLSARAPIRRRLIRQLRSDGLMHAPM
jgi:hypothetical protein